MCKISKDLLSTFFIILTLPIIGCSSLAINLKPIAVTVTELSACNKRGKPTKVFSSETERIFVCGHLETIEPIDINIYWYYQEELVFQQVGKDVEDYFYNFIQPKARETFPVGNYRIEVLLGDVVIEEASFSVK